MSSASRDLMGVAKAAPQPRPGLSGPTSSDRVVLQVGDRRFTTLRSTLTGESTYFAVRLSTRWDDREEDGSFFIDSDPDLFEHILLFCRSGVFPLFFDMATRVFDYGKYAAVLGEARYFGVERLEQWISDKRYLQAIVVRRKVYTAGDLNDDDGPYIPTGPANTLVDLSSSWGTTKVYICPRDIPVHYGDPSRCGQACQKAKERSGGCTTYDEIPITRGITFCRTLVFDPKVCLGEDEAMKTSGGGSGDEAESL